MNTPNPTQADLDDIMSSIRSSVEAESGKPPAGSADLVEQAAAEAAAAEAAGADDDDVLELTAADMAPVEPIAVPASAPVAEVPVLDVLGVPSLSPADEAADEFDKLLAEISAEKQTRAAEVAAVKEALLADIEPLGAEPVVAEAAPAAIESFPESLPEVQGEGLPAVQVEGQPEAQAEGAAEAPTEAPTEVAPEGLTEAVTEAVMEALPQALPEAVPARTHAVGMVAGTDGAMQLTLPAEVLVMALRPMVQGWLNANLPGVVENLVREEIAKMNG